MRANANEFAVGDWVRVERGVGTALGQIVKILDTGLHVVSLTQETAVLWLRQNEMRKI